MFSWVCLTLLLNLLGENPVAAFAGSVTNLHANGTGSRISSNIQMHPMMKEQRHRTSEPKGSSNRMDNNVETCN
jgi:hypothetical protein